MRGAVAWAFLLVGLSACAPTPVRPPPPPSISREPNPPEVPAVPAENELGQRAAEIARSYVGFRYHYGGSSPHEGFDCSGLVWYVYRTLGVEVPRRADEQRVSARPVALEELAPGDLVFFKTPVDHVGIYLGDGEFVHAPKTGRRVTTARLDAPFFILGYAGAGRIVPPG